MPPIRTERKAAAESHLFEKSKSKASTVTLKEEEGEDGAAPVPLTVQLLKGTVPPCQVPCAHTVDHENDIVFFNTFEYGEGEHGDRSEVFSCTLRKRTWKNVTEKLQFQSHVGARETEKQLPSRFGGGMALYKVNVSEQCTQTILLLFGGRVRNGAFSNEMLAIDVEKRRWWIVDVAGGNVLPRVESKLVIVGDQLFIFGGRNEEYVEDDGHHDHEDRWPWLISYSIATLRNHKWTWDVCDVPLPPDVQAIGVCNAAAAIQDGESPKILLTFCAMDSAITWDYSPYSLQARSFVIFDIALRTFAIQAEGRGTFPGDASWHDLCALSGSLKKKDPTPSAVVCTFNKDPAQICPELFIYSLPPQPSCRTVAMRPRIAATTGIVFELFVVVGSKLFLFGWTKDKWDEWDILVEIPI